MAEVGDFLLDVSAPEDGGEGAGGSVVDIKGTVGGEEEEGG